MESERRSFLLGLAGAPLAHAAGISTEDAPIERPEWAEHFARAGAVGSILVADDRVGSSSVWVYGPERARRRYTPASTFKIPHSLFALEVGLLVDEFQVIRWDGVRRPPEAWNRDQTLRSAMRNSVVWVYERFARELGPAREAVLMRAIDYGNALASGASPFWVEGDLAISCTEQIAFLRRLYRNQLPHRVEHQRLVKDVMVVEAGRDWILRAKTGWSGRIGRWVGWVEWPAGAVFFAINIDTPRRLEDLPKREAIARAVLRSIDALPPA
jgi:beta-lactamase class D